MMYFFTFALPQTYASVIKQYNQISDTVVIFLSSNLITCKLWLLYVILCECM